MFDPRPLTGEPLALDLVNTTWIDGDATQDLLDDPRLAAAWLAGRGLEGSADRRALVNLRAAREAIRGVLEHPGPERHEALRAVLARGAVRLTLDGDGRPAERIDVAASWRAAWLAARDLPRLLDERAERVKPCANEACVLWFDDTTRSGTRRWCSMTGGCGGRVKARRHQDRLRGA